jgi:CRISPR-associated endonuclease Csn1
MVDFAGEDRRRWVLGVDVGARSVGLAALEIDDEGPRRLLAAVSIIHDGGVDPDEERTGYSRKRAAGIARRLRRRYRRRRQRIAKLARYLASMGYPGDCYREGQTYKAWAARHELASQYIQDSPSKREKVALALMHIAHHRGWRSPWLSIDDLERQVKDEDDSARRKRLQPFIDVAESLGIDVTGVDTIGELGWRARKHLLRPRNLQRAGETGGSASKRAVFGERVWQVDLLYELMKICEVQQLPHDFYRQVRDLIFYQERPRVRPELVGVDPLAKLEGKILPRASVACLEFQEFRIRSALANLRIKDEQSGWRALSPEEYAKVFKYLWEDAARDLGEDNGGQLPWRAAIGQALGGLPAGVRVNFEGSRLIEDAGVSRRAPICETEYAFLTFCRKNGLRDTAEWWRNAYPTERADLIAFLVDGEESNTVDELLVKLPYAEQIILADEAASRRIFRSGRSRYSRETLRKLNEFMRDNYREDDPPGLHVAVQEVFRVPPDWAPPLEEIETRTGNPAVDRNIEAVRKFLMSATLKWGPPEMVGFELLREAGLSRQSIGKIEREQLYRSKLNQRLDEALRREGVWPASRFDRWRYVLMHLFGSRCAYCANAISWESSQLDHVVPRSTGGGSNSRANLLLVCENCNRRKGNRPFAIFAREQGIDVNAVIERVRRVGTRSEGHDYEEANARSSVRLWKWWYTRGELKAWKAEVEARLKMENFDEAGSESEDLAEERRIGATSYAARALRERIAAFLKRYDPKLSDSEALRKVMPFSGRVTARGRRLVGGTSDLPLVNVSAPGGEPPGESGATEDETGGSRRWVKERLDRRHHAVDAAFLAGLTRVSGFTQVAVVLSRLEDEISMELSREPQTTRANVGRDWVHKEALNRLLRDKPGWSEVLVNAQKVLNKVKDLVRAALEEDHVAVLVPRRLRAQNGALHADTIEKLVKKQLKDGFSSEEIERLVDGAVAGALERERRERGLSEGEDLPPNPERRVVDSNGRALEPSSVVDLFPSAKAMLLVRGGAAEMSKIHHARLYRWVEKRRVRYGIIRVFQADLVHLDRKKNLFVQELPVHSASMRAADRSVKEAVLSKRASQLGYLVVGDEIEFGQEVPGRGEIKELLALPELRQEVVRRWRIDGFPSPARVRLRPLYLAGEGVPAGAPAPVVKFVQKQGWRPAIDTVFSGREVRVLRRTYLGRPRWKEQGLPVSFEVGRDKGQDR